MPPIKLQKTIQCPRIFLFLARVLSRVPLAIIVASLTTLILASVPATIIVALFLLAILLRVVLAIIKTSVATLILAY
jgi:hypothetical protein